MDTSLKRIIAYILDILLVTVIVTIFSNIRLLNPYLEEYNSNYETYIELTEKYKSNEIEQEEYKEKMIDINYELSRTNVVSASITIVTLVLYFGVAQMFLEGKTFGKNIMKLKLVSNTEKSLNIGNYLIRSIVLNNIIFRILLLVGVFFLNKTSYYNYSSVIGFIESTIEGILIIMIILRSDGRGLHDIIARTKVISTKEISTENEAIEAKVKEVVKTKKNKVK